MAHSGMTRDRTLYPPMNDLRSFTVLSNSHVLSVQSECGVAARDPWDHTQPNMVVDLGFKLFRDAACKTCSQL